MLLIEHPDKYHEQYKYIFDVIFTEFLGIPYNLKVGKQDKVTLLIDNKVLTVESHFFNLIEKNPTWDSKEIEKLEEWDSSLVEWGIATTDVKIPVLFGRPEVKEHVNKINIGIDIFGSAFFMLTRYEEFISEESDKYGRYSAKFSMAYKFDFIERPIIDEYIEILWSAINKLWPHLRRKKNQFKISPTHDVDNPFLNINNSNFANFIRCLIGDIVKRNSPILFLNTLFGWLKYKITGAIRYRGDPNDTFNIIMNLNEDAGLQSSFYFMTIKDNETQIGGRYSLQDNAIYNLIEEISARGHEVGFHPTGDSFINETNFKRQAQVLFETANIMNIKIYGGRQHYLLWSKEYSANNWAQNGFSFDSTLGFADKVGFRCGTCNEYSLWDHFNNKKLNLKERPLIMMEASLLSQETMGLSFEEAERTIKKLKRACKIVNGNFVFLWHNCHLKTDLDWKLYKICISKD